MQHLSIVAGIIHSVVVIEQSQFYHQLATITYAQRQGILTSIEFIERLLSLRIIEESTSPSLCRTEYIGVRETTAESYEVHLLQCLATRDKVGHGNIFHVETCDIE